MNLSISTKDVNFENFVRTPPSMKTFDDKNGAKITYYEIPYFYKHKVTNEITGQVNEVITGLQVEGPTLYSPDGISLKLQPNGRMGASIQTIFDLCDKDVYDFVAPRQRDADGKEIPGSGGFWEELWHFSCHTIEYYKSLGVLGSTVSKDFRTTFTKPIMWFKDPQTDEIIKGRNPRKFFSIVYYEKDGKVIKKAPFKSPVKDEKTKNFYTYNWDNLKDSQTKFQALFNIKKIYIGAGKISIQCDIESAVVYSAISLTQCPTQVRTLEKATKDENIMMIAKSQIELLESISKKEERKEEKKEERKEEERKEERKEEIKQPIDLKAFLNKGPQMNPLNQA